MSAIDTLRGLIGAKTCGHPMQGIYGADSACARPAGHAGKHDTIWNWQDWGHDALADVEALLEAAKAIPPKDSHGSSAQVIVRNGKLIALAAAVRRVEGTGE